ncbi:MAG: hypothetical protein QG622_485, partial [Actinomycetota bacterium]|nr:hypothetical protein [Actinomycetota bacterium]
YLLFVDESGTHGGSHAFVLGGVAIHEDDAARLQRRLDELVIHSLGRIPTNLEEYELHVSEMKNAKKPPVTSVQRPSIWAPIPRAERNALLDRAYREIVTFQPTNPQLPLALFGVVVDASFRSSWATLERERFTYEVLLNKFDVMLKRHREQGRPNRGLVVHDRRVLAEQDIQSWVSEWRAAAGAIGQLRNLADVPLFSDSRATRLLQVADLVSYAIYRRYRPQRPPDISGEHFATLWPRFDADDGATHGCVHYTPSYGQRTCDCEPCEQRLLAAKSSSARWGRPKRG